MPSIRLMCEMCQCTEAVISRKSFIGKIERGFDFLGYHYSPEGLTVAKKTVANFIGKASRLYEQRRSTPSGVSPLEMYAKAPRWNVAPRLSCDGLFDRAAAPWANGPVAFGLRRCRLHQRKPQAAINKPGSPTPADGPGTPVISVVQMPGRSTLKPLTELPMRSLVAKSPDGALKIFVPSVMISPNVIESAISTA